MEMMFPLIGLPLLASVLAARLSGGGTKLGSVSLPVPGFWERQIFFHQMVSLLQKGEWVLDRHTSVWGVKASN